MTGSVWMWLAVVGHAQEDGLAPEDAEATRQVTGDVVDVETQRAVGLVTLVTPLGTCTGTLLNQYWVLTWSWCVHEIEAGSIEVEASWSSARPLATKLVEDTAPGWWPGPVLVFLGEGDFGPVEGLPLFASHLDETVQLRVYSRGITTLTPSSRDGSFRTGLFHADAYRDFDVIYSDDGQVVGLEDFGGPVIAEYDGVPLGIAAVQGGCEANMNGVLADNWEYMLADAWCYFEQVESRRDEILAVIEEVPSLVETATSTTYDGEPAVPAEPAPGTTYTGGIGGPWATRP